MKKLLIRLFLFLFRESINFKKNGYHPLVWINGNPIIGDNVKIAGFSEVYAKGSKVIIGENCDIGSFTAINCADSHLRTINIKKDISHKPIHIGKNVFIGSHVMIKGGTSIGDYCVIGAGTILGNIKIPPYSLVVGNPAIIKEGYYKRK